MKKIQILASSLCLVALSFALPAKAADSFEIVYRCKNTWVNERINNDLFEEGLGVYGSEDVDDDSEETFVTRDAGVLSVSIGQMSYDQNDGAKIEETALRNGTKTYVIRPEGDADVFVVTIKADKTGLVLYQKAGRGRAKTYVKIDCR